MDHYLGWGWFANTKDKYKYHFGDELAHGRNYPATPQEEAMSRREKVTIQNGASRDM